MALKHNVTGDQYRTVDRKMREIMRQLDQKNGSPLDPETVSLGLQTIIQPEPELVVGSLPSFPVIVEYDQSLEEMIKAGNYDWINSGITAKNFPIEGKGKAEHELILIHFNRSMISDQVLNKFGDRELEPALIEDLLALGAKYPEIQRQFPIICLGSVWTRVGCCRRVPFLRGSASERELSPGWFDDAWSDDCRFLARRK